VAQISSEGLLGGRYVSIVPGGSDELIAPGGSINYTQPPFDLVQALGEYIFTKPKDGGEDAKPSASSKAKNALPKPGLKMDQPAEDFPADLPAGE
jgi:phospholipid/cholesterol/gamma-HCH transport system substrate-binding protein